MRKIFVAVSLTVLLTFIVCGAAFASHADNPGDRTKTITASNCIECHENSEKHTVGPHGGYATGTDKCSTCHDVHADAENPQLLMGETLTDACNYCHDLTATSAGPYNMTGDFAAAAAHRVVGIAMDPYTDTEGQDNAYLLDGIVAIPGGDDATGGEGVLDTSTQGKLSGQVFTCNSCHTPHGVNTVSAYLGESQVKYSTINLPEGVEFKLAVTNRLLKTKPNNVTNAVYEYSSSWCATCHQGRDNGIAPNHNHPVDVNAPAYRFLEYAKALGQFVDDSKTIADITADGWVTVGTSVYADLKVDPRNNKQYAMNPVDELTGTDRSTVDGYDDLSNYLGIGPSCQQCHGSARDIEAKFAANANPQRINFPHISNVKGLLVEENDDFCTNCHAPSVLP